MPVKMTDISIIPPDRPREPIGRNLNNGVTRIESAYRTLHQSEKVFVDGFVDWLENKSNSLDRSIQYVASQPVPAHIVRGSRGMFERPLVNAAITERVLEISASDDFNANQVLKRMRAIAMTSLGDFMEFDGDGKPVYNLHKATPEQLAAVKTWKEVPTKFGLPRYEFVLHDSVQALDRLGRYFGLWDKDSADHRARVSDERTIGIPETANTAEAAQAYGKMIGA